MVDERILKNIPDLNKAQKVEALSVDKLTEQSFRREFIDKNKPLFIIRRCWDRHQFKKPGLLMLFAAYYGIVTLLAQIPYRFQLVASR